MDNSKFEIETSPDLIRLAQSGNEDAFSELFARYLPMIDSLCFQFKNRSSADQELRSEAILSFWKAVKKYDIEQDQVTFGLFASICIRNRLIGFLRKKHLQTLPLDDDRLASFHANAESDPAYYVAKQEQYLELEKIVNSVLSDRERQVWFRYMSGQTIAEIAEALKKEKKSVENAIFRARKKLRSAFPPHN